MIELINFTKSYSSKSDFAVRNVSMTCNRGEITGLLGLNGEGKTTILKAITARHFATSGEVSVDGVNPSENLEKVRNLTGFVEEEPKLPKEFTVAEYLTQVANLHEHSLRCEEQSDETISLSLEELLPKKIGTLSKGQRQRVNFAQALIYNPKVLVLDEPASGLDPAQILNMRALVKSLKNDRTILLSTHLMQEVEALCDKIYILHGGKIVAYGTPDEISKKQNCKNLEEAFFRLTNSTCSGTEVSEQVYS